MREKLFFWVFIYSQLFFAWFRQLNAVWCKMYRQIICLKSKNYFEYWAQQKIWVNFRASMELSRPKKRFLSRNIFEKGKIKKSNKDESKCLLKVDFTHLLKPIGTHSKPKHFSFRLFQSLPWCSTWENFFHFVSIGWCSLVHFKKTFHSIFKILTLLQSAKSLLSFLKSILSFLQLFFFWSAF